MDPTNTKTLPDAWAVFERYRGRLFKIARRMLRSADDAEDVVQETALRWLQTDPARVRAPEGWLIAVATRLSVDHLRRTARDRQANSEAGYLGAVAASDAIALERSTELPPRLSTAFRMLCERLEPAERAAFVLRDVFDCEYVEIARVLEKSEAACRQIVHRARERLRQDRWRVAERRPGTRALTQALTGRFVGALSAGNREAVLAVLADGGASVSRRARRPERSLPLTLPWRRPCSPASRGGSVERIVALG